MSSLYIEMANCVSNTFDIEFYTIYCLQAQCECLVHMIREYFQNFIKTSVQVRSRMYKVARIYSQVIEYILNTCDSTPLVLVGKHSCGIFK
jgi:hypothetical protein